MSLKQSVNFLPLLLLLTASVAKSCEIYSTSPTCDHFQQLERSLDRSVDPCEDFYSHACNNWALEHSSTEYNTTVGVADYQMNLKLITVMESFNGQPLATTDQDIFNKSYIYYKSCVDERVRDISRYFDNIKPGEGLEWPLLQELEAHLRGDTDFVVEDWPAESFDLFTLLGKLHSYGLNNVMILHTWRRTSEGLGFTLVGPWLAKTQSLTQATIVTLLRSLGLTADKALEYAESIEKTERSCLGLYNKFQMSSRGVHLSYENMKEIYPQIANFLDLILPQDNAANKIHMIDVYFLDYFLFLINTEWEAREAQDLCNYLMIKFLLHVLEGKQNELTKLACVRDLRNNLDFPINLLYYQHIYKPEELHYTDDITALANKTRDYVVETLKENHLNFTPKYLKLWQTELSAIGLNLGNIPPTLYTSQIEKPFRHLPDLQLSNYYDNHLQVLRHRFLKSLLVHESQMVTHQRIGSSSKPYYDVDQHMLVVPLGIVQPPIYHHSFDPLFKWSMLGYQLAHDYTQAIAFSLLLHSNSKTYVNCIREQGYLRSKYEGVPDLVGAEVAYRAYSAEQDFQAHTEFKDSNWKQLFFLNLAQYFCVRPEGHLKQQYAARLKHVIMNMDSFAEAFQCPVGSAMNPQEKCRFF